MSAYLCGRCPLPRYDPGPELRAVVDLYATTAPDSALHGERLRAVLERAGRGREQLAKDFVVVEEARARALAAIEADRARKRLEELARQQRQGRG